MYTYRITALRGTAIISPIGIQINAAIMHIIPSKKTAVTAQRDKNSNRTYKRRRPKYTRTGKAVNMFAESVVLRLLTISFIKFFVRYLFGNNL